MLGLCAHTCATLRCAANLQANSALRKANFALRKANFALAQANFACATLILAYVARHRLIWKC